MTFDPGQYAVKFFYKHSNECYRNNITISMLKNEFPELTENQINEILQEFIDYPIEMHNHTKKE